MAFSDYVTYIPHMLCRLPGSGQQYAAPPPVARTLLSEPSPPSLAPAAEGHGTNSGNQQFQVPAHDELGSCMASLDFPEQSVLSNPKRSVDAALMPEWYSS